MPTGPGLPGQINPRQSPLDGMSEEGKKRLLIKVKTESLKRLVLLLLRRRKG